MKLIEAIFEFIASLIGIAFTLFTAIVQIVFASLGLIFTIVLLIIFVLPLLAFIGALF